MAGLHLHGTEEMLLTRKEASTELLRMGIRRSPSTLAKVFCTRSDGPPSRERGGHALADPVRRSPNRVVRQVGVSAGGADVTVTEQFADKLKPFSAGQPRAREAVPKVMDPQVFHPGPFADADPGPVEIGDRTCGIPPIREHIDAPVREQALDQLQRRAPETDDLRACLGIFKPKHSHGAINLRPLELGDLVLAGAGQREKADDVDVARIAPVLFEVRQNVTEPGQFGRRKEAIPAVVLVALHAARWVGLHELPLNGEREDAAQQTDRPRGRMNAAARMGRRLPTNASRSDVDHQPLDVRSADIGDLHPAQARFDMASDADAVDAKGRRLLHRHALLHVEVAELRHRQFFTSFDFGPLRVTT
uniref:Uncharacterized protein n=1 Tax=Parastrongyloides trichosuri TaxID=131310 RepID=A0A0N4ZCT9_PARTI